MVEEIKNQIELRIAKLEIEKSKAVNDRYYEYSCELGDQIKGLKIALEIVNTWKSSEKKNLASEKRKSAAEKLVVQV